MKITQFKKEILRFYQKSGRHHLPWRQHITPYRVCVSEIMLQQTPVDRVIPFFRRWMKEFPSWRALVRAPQHRVLALWKGLGYNSRALRLHQCAKIVSEQYHGRLPKDMRSLMLLPGIGPYTAGAIRVFTWNLYVPFIETNIRRVFIYYFFSDKKHVSDQEIFEQMEKLGDIENPRLWYYALMDYGAHLPKTIRYNPNRQSRHYAPQKAFKGSDREIRGKILEIILGEKNHRITENELLHRLTIIFSQQKNDFSHKEALRRYTKILMDLERENFLKRLKKSVFLK